MGTYMSTPNRDKETTVVKGGAFHVVACTMQGRGGQERNTREVGVLVSLSVCTLRRFGGRARHLEEGIMTYLPYLLGCFCFR